MEEIQEVQTQAAKSKWKLNIDFPALATKAWKALKNLGYVAFITAAIFVGFEVDEIYHFYEDKMRSTSMQESRKVHETSVAINERQELMILNRKDGSYQVFQDSVGRMIFALYADKISSEVHLQVENGTKKNK